MENQILILHRYTKKYFEMDHRLKRESSNFKNNRWRHNNEDCKAVITTAQNMDQAEYSIEWSQVILEKLERLTVYKYVDVCKMRG